MPDQGDLILEMQKAEADIMAILTAAGPVLLEELRAGSAYMQAKSEATAHFKSGERALALDAYEACLQILKSNPLPHEAHTTTDGDAALKLKALGAEMAKVNSNCSMLYLDIGQLEAAIVAGAAAISNCPSWPKAHGRHGKALEAAGQHDRAAQAYAMAALRAGQQKQPAEQSMWARCSSTERQRASEAVAAAKQRASEEELERAAAEFVVFFDRAMSLSVLTGAEFDALKNQIAQGEASEGQLVLAWRPALHQKEAQQNAGLFAALDETVTECILELLSMKGLARMEQTCVYFSGTLDPTARERLRRKTRCARLLRSCLRTEPAAPPEVAALGPSIERYCTTLLDDPDQALEAMVNTCTPVLLDSFRQSRSQQGILLCPALEALQTLRTGMTTARREAFWRCYLRIRADWLRSKTKQERDRLTRKRYGLVVMEGDEDCLLAALRLARVEHVLFAEDMVALLHTIHDLSSWRNEADELAHDDEATVRDWVAAYDCGRAMAGVDLEVLLTLDKLLTDRRWYEPHPEIRESLHMIIQNTFRATVNTLGMSPLRDVLGQHLMQFHAIYHRGPNRFPDPRQNSAAAFAALLDTDPELVANWQAIFREAKDWLAESERLGYALHLRAHHILFCNFDPAVLEVDYFSFQALLITRNLELGCTELGRQLDRSPGLAAFFADLRAMVAAYQRGHPATQQWMDRQMARHSSMDYMSELFR